MRKTATFLGLFIIVSCGSGLDGEEEVYFYTFILINETGATVVITGDSPERVEELQNGQSFSCGYTSISGTAVGICEDYVFIFFPQINKGYQCYGGSGDTGLCFEGGCGVIYKT